MMLTNPNTVITPAAIATHRQRRDGSAPVGKRSNPNAGAITASVKIHSEAAPTNRGFNYWESEDRSDRTLNKLPGWSDESITTSYSSSASSFGADMGAPPGAGFAVNVFLRDGDKVYRTWHTDGRGTEQLSYTFGLIDILPWGRQEEWQDSPDGWPKAPTYSKWLAPRAVSRYPDPELSPARRRVPRPGEPRHASSTVQASGACAGSWRSSAPRLPRA